MDKKKILTEEETKVILYTEFRKPTDDEKEALVNTVLSSSGIRNAINIFNMLLEAQLDLNREWLPDNAYDNVLEMAKETKLAMSLHHLEPTIKEPLKKIGPVTARKLLNSVGITTENRSKFFVAIRKNHTLGREVLGKLLNEFTRWNEG